MTVLTVLIPTIEERRLTLFNRMITEVERQRQEYLGLVDVISLYDSRRMTAGAKRNWLLQMAGGDFIVFFDDDDRIAPDYFATVIPVLQQHPTADVVVYDQICTINGGAPIHCRYGLELEYTWHGQEWTGKPAHTMIWKRTIAQSASWPDSTGGEDMPWVAQAVARAQTEVRIDRALYYYDFDHSVSRTLG